MSKSNLVKVDFRVCCNHSRGNPVACIETMDAILQQFNNIVTITPTRPHGEAEDMCVIGTARIDPNMKEKFRRDLKNLKFSSRTNRQIKKVLVQLPQ